ncbi:hypothetical protein B0T09DRAFT_243509, partial [Sordaria sp. MPI-SDFR-AT-0083]
MDLDEFEEFHDSQDGGEQPEGDSSTPSDGLVKGLLKALSGSASLRDPPTIGAPSGNAASAATGASADPGQDTSYRRKPLTLPIWDGQPHTFQFYYNKLVKTYNADIKAGVRTDREAAWIEILDTLPLDKQQQLEGFWTAKTASGDDDPVALLDQIRIIFGAYQTRDSALDKLTLSLSDDYRTCVAQLQYHAAKYEQTSEFKEDHHKYLRGQRNRSRSSNNYYLPALSVGNTQGPQS